MHSVRRDSGEADIGHLPSAVTFHILPECAYWTARLDAFREILWRMIPDVHELFLPRL